MTISLENKEYRYLWDAFNAAQTTHQAGGILTAFVVTVSDRADKSLEESFHLIKDLVGDHQHAPALDVPKAAFRIA